MEEIAAGVAQSLFPGQEKDLLRRMTAQRMSGNDLAAYRRVSLAVVRYRPGGGLKRIICPVLVVAGDDDRVVPGEYQARLRAGIPHAEFVTICGGGHACNIDYADEVNAAALRFLERQA
jgi:pimeloyl-ACP methyl ester carboxylesterase